MLLVVLLSPKMLNAGNTFAGGQPFSGLLRAGFITLGVRKIKIVPLSQKHAQQYTHTRRQFECVSVCRGNQPAVANCRKKGQAKQKNKPSARRGQAMRRGDKGQGTGVLAGHKCAVLCSWLVRVLAAAFAYIISHVILVSHIL